MVLNRLALPRAMALGGAVLLIATGCSTTADSASGDSVTGATAVTATKVVGGEAHTCAILSDRSLKCWGANGSGQLGQGDSVARGIAAGQMGSALKSIDLGSGRTALDVAAGGSHTCAVLDDQTVKCWGENRTGQLGLGDASARGKAPGQMGDALPVVNLGSGLKAKSVAAGKQHTCAVLTNGSVKCWGYNARGELGIGNTTTMGIRPEQMGDALPAVRLGTGRTVTSLSSGWYFNCALLDIRSVKCWGFNNYGQLGVGDTANRGTSASQMGDALAAVDLGKNSKGLPAEVEGVSAGGGQACGQIDWPGDKKRQSNIAKCWGLNEQGQLGQGDTKNRGVAPGELGDNLPAIDLGTSVEVEEVTTGAYQTCMMLGVNGKKRESIKCFGGNDRGQLGLGDTKNRGDQSGEMGSALPSVSLDKTKDYLDVGVGGWQSCAILTGVGAKCWGGNDTGQLCLGDAVNRGDKPNQMGKALPPISLS